VGCGTARQTYGNTGTAKQEEDMTTMLATVRGQGGLPVTYEAAVSAVALCLSLDECKDWADKAAALASYAKQAKDERLMKMAIRIRDRAIRRSGELLEQIEPGHGARDGKRADGGDTPLTRTQAARDLAKLKHEAALPILTAPERSRVREAILAIDAITDRIITRI
jgi:hypothetical protein